MVKFPKYSHPESSFFIPAMQLYLKVHKHEIFFLLFLQKPKPYGPMKIVFDSAEIFDF
jgi:hypothetical protein